MANTYNFTTTDDTFSLLVNGTSVGTWKKWDGKDILNCNISIRLSGTGIVLSLADPYYSALIRPGDTLQMAGEALTGSITEKSQSLTGEVLTSSTSDTGDPGASTIVNALPLVYVAALNQSGTDAPVVSQIFTNTIGDIVWTRSSVGHYYGTLTGAFPPAKTICPPFGRGIAGHIALYNNTPGDTWYRVIVQDNNRIGIVFLDAEGNFIEWSGTGAEITVRVEVYPE